MMTNQWREIIFPVAFTAVIFTNVLWYAIKHILKSNGYEIHYLSKHFRDIPNMHDLINNEQDQAKAKKYRVILTLFYVSFMFIITCFFLVIKTSSI